MTGSVDFKLVPKLVGIRKLEMVTCKLCLLCFATRLRILSYYLAW